MSGETSLYPEHARPGRPGTGWTGRDLVTGTSLIALLVALFMPWFSATSSGASSATGSADGPGAHGYIWFVFALVIIALIVLASRETISRVPGNLPSPQQMLTIATGLALLLTILGTFIKPSSLELASSTGAPITVSVGFSYGGFVALVAALVAFLGTIGAGGRLNTARLGGPAMRRHPSTSSPE
jgi:hypothetical protein